MKPLRKYALILLLFQFQLGIAQTTNISVAVDKPGFEVPSTLFGLFFEDINFGADGGLYPERVKNRSFEFPDAMMAWKSIGTENAVTVHTENAINQNNSHYVRINPKAGISNEGFRGMGVQKGAVYVFSVYARQGTDPSAATALRMELQDENGKVIGTARIAQISSTWKRYSVIVRPTGTSLKANLNVLA